MTNPLNISKPFDVANDKVGRLNLSAGDTANRTVSLNYANHNNRTRANHAVKTAKNTSFYGQILPKEVAVLLVLSILQYWWFIWLERMLPARPNRKGALYRRGEKVEESEDCEEEAVEKWIAQSRVKRTSLNWCNTFLKCLLELTLGRLSKLHPQTSFNII